MLPAVNNYPPLLVYTVCVYPSITPADLLVLSSLHACLSVLRITQPPPVPWNP